MSTRSASPFSVLSTIDDEAQNRFFGGLRNGRCSRCHELGIHTISSRWESVAGEGTRFAPSYDGSMDADIAIFMKRLIRDKNYPLVDICWCCNFVNLWSNGLGLSRPTFKRRTILEFGVSDISNLAEPGIGCQDSREVTMLDLPKRQLPVARWTGLRPDYQLIRGWLRTCSSSHTACLPDWSEYLEDIRVINVKHRSVIRLSKKSPYLALSYVWGSSNQPSFPVSGANLPFRLPRKLPQTIEDAMRVTRKLGFDYLWVDSVCIDQSNLKDKATQIGIMDRIYLGAYATIVALGSSSADSGLCRVKSRRIKERQMPVYHQGAIRYLSFLPTLREELDQSMWMKRGWTYQEGILSHRCIFFGQQQVFFTCNAISISEDGLKSHGRSRRPRRYDSRLAIKYHEPRDLVNPFKISSTWKSIPQSMAFGSVIGEYTDRKFKNEEDVLYAIAGVLELLKATILPKGFLFGLPLDLFRSALLWTHTSVKPLYRRGTDRFPSWSWASWQLTSPISVENDLADHESHAQPPLSIRHLDQWIVCGFKDSAKVQRRSHDVPMTDRLQALYRSTDESLFMEEDTPIPNTREGLLYVKGILLGLPYSRIFLPPGPNSKHQEPSLQFAYLSPDSNKREQSFFMSQEAFLEPLDYNEKYDFLFVSAIPIVDFRLIWLQLLVLKWKNGIAQRIGVARILFKESELAKLWPECNARYRGFWLG